MSETPFDIKEIIAENALRQQRLATDSYDPLRGIGCCCRRVEVNVPGSSDSVFVPEAMTKDPGFDRAATPFAFNTLRMKYDFEFWCATCVSVKDKTGYRNIKLRLNRPQRIIASQLEEMRESRQPIRAIILKARQCGISTLIQAYMAWIQLIHRDNWHSLVCAHIRDAAATIKGMMTKLLDNYPAEYMPDGVEKLRLRPFEGSRSISRIDGRQNNIAVCSAENQDAVRGSDIAMAHLSEVAFWRETPGHDPNDIIRSVAGSVAMTELTLIVMESTANGVGNFFHDEWLRAKAGFSDKRAVFVPWYDYGIYSVDVDDYEALWNSFDKYERKLWQSGLTLQQIAWYHFKRREYSSHKSMQAEYPTTDVEAFTSTDRMVFDMDGIERMRCECRNPSESGDIVGDAVTGKAALQNVRFVPSPDGLLKIWKPRAAVSVRRNRYIVVVDIGGRSDGSDYSVIAVIDRGERDGCRPEVAAQWRGHTDHDLLAWKAAQIAQWYHRALLVVESNSLETEMTEGENSGFILEEIADYYPNMYYRQTFDKLSGNYVSHIGFHVNRSTKPLIVNRQIAAVRDGMYAERDIDCVNEHAAYERKQNGSYGAKDGHHDDILMTRCIGLFVDSELVRDFCPPPPKGGP